MLLDGDGAPSGRITDALDADFAQPVSASALLVWIAPQDCNGNTLPDALEIAVNPSLDLDADGTIDTCAVHDPDVDGNGLIDFGDVALVILDFGPCTACSTDQDGNGVVDFGDVAIVLLSFGS
jgi:hypothetical protein